MSSFGPGDNRRVPGRVLMPSLIVDHVCRIESRSVLLAQRPADLIRLGARFAPCMRPDPLFTSHVVERQKRWDRA
ncbi:hypothetical protein FBUS_10594 [Fasciolopsis buskii]|uniref:Uncharacterized protein n=1 Tax=Fasciolopsis buskii TaxID=27845 RepID=A0A8E0RNL0_9TREM|nr:hypothetical protein FBUS_10594 [Fasciolopsis buski]